MYRVLARVMMLAIFIFTIFPEFCRWLYVDTAGLAILVICTAFVYEQGAEDAAESARREE